MSDRGFFNTISKTVGTRRYFYPVLTHAGTEEKCLTYNTSNVYYPIKIVVTNIKTN